MNKTLQFAAAALTALCMPAFAMGAGVADLDADGDGLVTVAEVQAVYPDVTEDQFSAMDTNADGSLDEAELQAATDAGMMPAS